VTEGNDKIACVGAVIHDRRGRLLLIRRGQEPGRGLWSLPGGRVEPGETDHEAVVREVAEETGLRVRPGRLVGRVSRAAPSGGVYDIADYACEVAGEDALRSGTDADDARWVTAADYAGLPLVYGMTEALTEWDQLPRA
jgi:ADP-ribose pyrophosphatase YjhB (NUDIX family)